MTDIAPTASTASPARSIVFIDSRVQDAATLLQGLEPGTEVVFLQAGQDGLAQMAAALGERGDVGTVQVIAHGSAGQLWLGNSFLDNAALQLPGVQAQLAALGRGLTADGDLLVYACNTAQGAEGAQFVSTLAALTGADVAASDDRTGAGGDGELEISTGHIAGPVALPQDVLAGYDLALATLTVTSNTDDGPGSLRAAIAAATAGDTITFIAPMTIGLSTKAGVDSLLILNKNLTIDGDLDNNGTADVTVNGNAASRVLSITTGTVVLDGLAITNGKLAGADGIGGSALGAGISVTGTGTQVTILHSGIFNNVATGGEGLSHYYGGRGGNAAGGLYIGSGATVQMAVSTLTSNTGQGGTGGYGAYAGGTGGNATGGVSVAGGGTFRYQSGTVTISGNTGTGGIGGVASPSFGIPGSFGTPSPNISGSADNSWAYTPPAPTVTLSVSSASVAEAAGTATVTATLSAAAAADTTVTIGRQSGSTAMLTDDFTLSSTTITIAAGQTNGTATLTAVQDAVHEGNETAIIEITGVAGGGGATESGIQQQTVTITDDDPTPSLSISNASQAEGNSGSSNLTFTVTLSAASAQAVTVNYATFDGTATTADNDYTASSGTLTFAPGETSQTFTVAVVGDTKAEPNETFTVSLNSPHNATLGTASAIGTIINDENAAPVAVADSLTVAEGGTATTLVGGATSVLANDTDAEASTLVSVLVTGPAHGSLTLNANGTFSYVHNGSDTTTDSFSYKPNDGTADGNTVSVAITVTPVNDAPTITGLPGSAQAVTAGAAAALADFAVTDADGAAASLTVTLTATNGTINGLTDADTNQAGIQLSGTAAAINAAIASATFTAGAAGAASIGVSVSDGIAPAVTGTYHLSAAAAAAVNNAPTVANAVPDQTASEGSAFNFQFAANTFADVDVGDTLSYTAQLAGGGALPAWLTFDPGTRTFSGTPANVGTVSIKVVADDGHGGTVSDRFELVIGAAPVDPGPDPVPPVTPPVLPPTPGIPDNDGVPSTVEDQAPGIPGPGGVIVAGDGNGDGIKDSQQAEVASITFLLSPTVQTNPGNAAPTFTTLVTSSQDGKVGSGNDNSRILSLQQLDAPQDVPGGMQTPLGLVSFTVALAASKTGENFSLYLDPALGINGYWKQDASGTWVNLASEPYGGKMVMEGGRLRLDFRIEDGGQFDADGKADGIITDQGAPAYLPLSIVGQAPELFDRGFWF